MARTYRNLWPDVVRWENLLLAYRKCRRRKRYKIVATEFDFRWEENLLQLQRELCDGTYEPGEYRHFYISEPKPRKISAAPFRDRVVHHALVTVLEPLFERRFIYDSYACRRGKGTHRALDRTQKYLRRFDWCLKTDVVRFFPNVDHQLLFQQISKTIQDRRVLDLIAVILRSGEGVLSAEATQHLFPGDGLFSVLRPRGLPIGNLTSQFFANVYLDSVDHHIKEQLQVPGYVRYADDLLLFGDTKESPSMAPETRSDGLQDDPHVTTGLARLIPKMQMPKA
jgi:RNA-directed DNA polymerase